MRRFVFVVAGIAVVACFWLLHPLDTLAATITVTTTADDITPNDGSISLREAITAINAGNALGDPNITAQNPGTFGTNDTIHFNIPGSGVKTILVGTDASALDATLPSLDVRMVIDGTTQPGYPTTSNIVVDGNNLDSVFFVSGPPVTLNGLTIQHGNGAGGGIYNNAGATLTVTNSTFSNNTANSGGAIYNSNTGSTLTVTNSTFSNNTASGTGGGITNVSGTVTVTNSTFSGNSAGSGGGIANVIGGTLTVTNSTFTGNTASTGGGIFNSAGTLATLTNTIVANSTGGDLLYGGTVTGTHNLIDVADPNGRGFDDGVNGNIVGHPALLGTLGSYGGATQTIPLLPGSPALDVGDDATCNTTTGTAPVNHLDQRGIIRPQGMHCDIGAFEARFTLTISAGNNQSAVATTPFLMPLGVSFGGPDAPTPPSGAVVTFTAPGSGPSATFTGNPATTNVNGLTAVPATANPIAGGPYTVIASTPGAASVAFMLTNTAPNITVIPPALLPGVKNLAYPATTLFANGGTAPYIFTVPPNVLPPGLTLGSDGTLSGTPTATGQFTFTVTATDKYGFTGTQQYPITVAPAPLVGITITPITPTLKVGQVRQMTATGFYADNSTADITSQVIWSSTIPAVATIDASGKATAQTPGGAPITATQGGVTGFGSVAVIPPQPTGIIVPPAPASRPDAATSGGTGSPTPAPLPSTPPGDGSSGGSPPNASPTKR